MSLKKYYKLINDVYNNPYLSSWNKSALFFKILYKFLFDRTAFNNYFLDDSEYLHKNLKIDSLPEGLTFMSGVIPVLDSIKLLTNDLAVAGDFITSLGATGQSEGLKLKSSHVPMNKVLAELCSKQQARYPFELYNMRCLKEFDENIEDKLNISMKIIEPQLQRHGGIASFQFGIPEHSMNLTVIRDRVNIRVIITDGARVHVSRPTESPR